MYDWLSDEITAGSYVITANHRLAKVLKEHHDDVERGRGLSVWQTPTIRSLDSWLLESVNFANVSGGRKQRLSATASAIVWDACIARQSGNDLLSRSAFVREARQAWRRLQEWGISLEVLDGYVRSSDERLFFRCARQYEATLSESSWLDETGLAAEFRRLLAAGAVDMPSRVVFAGFDRKTPEFELLCSTLTAAGVAVADAPLPDRTSNASTVKAPSAEAELRSAGNWARTLLLQDPERRIAIVVPGLEQNGPRYSRLVREGLVPGWQAADDDLASCLNISYGRKLADYPMVAVALLCLRWLSNPLPFAEVSSLLRSRFIGESGDAGRSQAERRLRRSPDRPWTRAAVTNILERTESVAMLDWIGRVKAIDEFAGTKGHTQAVSVWAKSFADSLDRLGWPGKEGLGSNEFQVVNRWRQLLNEFARLDSVAGPMSCSQAVELLISMAAEIVFQPRQAKGTVNLLGVLETAGMEFDAVWCAGMDAARWPMSGRTVNLLPRRLQIERAMPDSTPDESLAFGQKLFDRLMACADEIVLSWPEVDEEAELLPSPFLGQIDETNIAARFDPGWYAAAVGEGFQLATVTPDPVPPVPPGDKVGGGAYTLQQQRTEPLGALVGGRLNCESLPKVETGISPSIRGRIIHRALQQLYGGRPSQANIAGWSESTLAENIADAAEAGVRRYRLEADLVLRRLLDFEKDRVEALLADFIRLELERPDFTVSGVEVDVELVLEGLPISVRIDRLDDTEAGTVIVDYKSGAVKTVQKNSGEIADLQLAVYACAIEDDIAGLVLANLDSRLVVYKGAGVKSEWQIFKDEEPAWQEKLAAWKQEVRTQAILLKQGDARINVARAGKDARPLAVISRIAEHKHVD